MADDRPPTLLEAARWLVPWWLLGLFVCVATGWIGLAIFGVTGPGRSTPYFAQWPFLDMWMRWDAGWYQGIATDGYYFSATQQSSVAFFPLYPMLIRAGVWLGLNPYVAGILWTLVAGFAAMTVFLRWAGLLAGTAAARRATWILMVWPFAYYLYGAVYSDALFLLLVGGAFLNLEEDRPWLATLLGALATATRPVAPAVVIGLLVRHVELRRRRKEPWGLRDLVPLLAGGGMAAYMVFLWIRFGDPIAFVTTQKGWRQLTGTTSILKLDELAQVKSTVDLTLPLFHAVLALGFLSLVLVLRKRLGWGYAGFVAVVVGMPLLSSRDFIGLGRYALAAFPCFLALSLLWESRRRWFHAHLLLSAALLVWMTARFALGRYVA